MEKNILTTPARLYNIEFLRILFTFFIFTHHAMNSLHIGNDGLYAVEFFFILSGFFLNYTIDNQKNIQAFAFKKIIRFLPLMLFGEIVCDLVNLKFPWQNYISLASFLPSTGLTHNNYYSVGAVWYICVIFWISIFYFYLIKNQDKSVANIVLCVVCLSSLIIYNQQGYHSKIWLFPDSMLRGFGCMGLGYFLSLIYKENNLLPPPRAFRKKARKTKG